MLVELRIRNFAVIKEAALEFGPGFNVLSGETGAGKTIIMSALGLLLGSRASPEMIRSGAKEAAVEGVFELEGDSTNHTFEGWRNDGAAELLIRRTIAEGGRSRVLVNDELTTVQSLARIGAGLVQVYGQHEQQSLLRAENHREMLDRYAELGPTLERYRLAYDRAWELKRRLDELSSRQHDRASALELARFRVNELEKAGIAPGEDEELVRERTVLANAARLVLAANEAEELIYRADGSAIDAVARAQARLADGANLDAKLAATLELMAAARANLEEAAHALAGYCEQVAADPARLEQVEARLQELAILKRKYGGSLDSAMETLQRSREELASLENYGQERAAAESELAGSLAELAKIADELSIRRHRDAAKLKRLMETELKALGMRNPTFEAIVKPVEARESSLVHDGRAMGPDGSDQVEFQLSPNLGLPPMPLGRIASGGELSRVMLALKSLEARRRELPTMIFDEVDAGIGGEVAQEVGRKLKHLARFHQILCVTHLAQVAAFADRHFVVEKIERQGATVSSVSSLSAAARDEEIARMLGGAQISDKFRRAARELIERAQT